MRYSWTLERDGRVPRSGLDSIVAFMEVLRGEELPGVMPPDWLVAALQMDEDDEGMAFHVSPFGWTIRVRRMA